MKIDFIKNLFSIKKEKSHKVIKFFGLKLKIKNKRNVDNIAIQNDLKILKSLIDIRNIPPATGYIRNIQSILFDILKLVHTICEKHNIPYWLEGGTLLGAIRHKGFIPWDDDLDISMMYEDYIKFKSIIKDELKNTNYEFLQVESHIAKILNKDFYPENNEKLLNFLNWSENERLYMALDIFTYHYIKDEMSDIAEIELKKARFEKIKLYKKYKNIDSYKNIQDFLDNLNARFTSNEKQKKCFLGLETIDQKIMIFNSNDIFPLRKVEFEGEYFYAPNNYKAILQEQYDDYMKPVFYSSHLNFSNICKEDKIKLLSYKTIEEQREGV